MGDSGACGGRDENGSDDPDKILNLLNIIKKYDLKRTEQTLRQEAMINEVLSEPERYSVAYDDLLAFINGSRDIYKPELSMVLYPVLMHIYLKLVRAGHPKEARQLLDQHGDKQDRFYCEYLEELTMIRRPAHMEDNDFVKIMENNKFIVRMSSDSYALLMEQLEQSQLELIADIVSQHMCFDRFEGTARNKAQCDATMGSQIGEAKRQDNRGRVFYGLITEKGFQGQATVPLSLAEAEGVIRDPFKIKKRSRREPALASQPDPNAPASNRIPLPELKEAIEEQLKRAMEDAVIRKPLGRNALPSICMYTAVNAYEQVICAEICDDSSLMALGCMDSSIKLIALAPVKMFDMKSPSQLSKISIDDDDVLYRMLDERSGETQRSLIGHGGPVYRCSFAPDNKVLLSCSADTTIRLWSMQTWTCVVVFKGHLNVVWDVRFSPHGLYFVSGSYDKTVCLWSTSSNRPLRVLTGHFGDVDCVEFHPNSNYVASGSSDRTIRLWDMLDGQTVRLMTGHKAAVYSLAFSGCGRYLASGSADHTVIVWDLSGGQLLKTLRCHEDTLHTVAFSRDNTLLAVGGMDSKLSLWDFTQMAADYTHERSMSKSRFYNPQEPHGDAYLLRTFATKSTPLIKLHFDRSNVLFGVGSFNPN